MVTQALLNVPVTLTKAVLTRHPALRKSAAFAIVLSGLAPLECIAAEKQTLSFAVTEWNTAMHETAFMDECPEGPNPGNYEIWEASVSVETRRNQPMLPVTNMRHAINRGANGESVCEFPLSVQDPPLKIVEGKYSYGINLDGDTSGEATEKSCKHENFTGFDDQPGIDNQMYRLFGCVQAWRSYGHIENNANSHRLSSGLGMILIEVTDIDDMTNDDEVTVTFFRGVGAFPLDNTGKVLPYASYDVDHVDGVPRYKDTVSGKIVDGVLMTDSSDVKLPFFGNYQYMRQLYRDMQLHMPLETDDRTTSGMIYSYLDVEQMYSYVRGLLVAFPNRHKYSCPSIYVAAHELADGHPDPVTGECTSLSSAFKIEAVPAFVVHPNPDLVSLSGASLGSQTTSQN